MRQDAEVICQRVLMTETFQSMLTASLASAMAQMLPGCVDAQMGKVLKRCDEIDQRLENVQKNHQSVIDELKSNFQRRLDLLERGRQEDANSDATHATHARAPLG
jgi:DNA anti-recombination protein RmuC